ncbi:MAG: spore coat protein CotJB [Lachnospiraceae bacterium]|nr:spore coat protein CotJB [Lachnospiraceae bacterium]
MNREGAMYGNGRNMRSMMGSRPGMGVPDGRTRTANGSAHTPEGCVCSTDGYSEAMEVSDIPTGSRQQLLRYLDEVSFCAYDLMLYLDTHPNDERAREHFHKYNHRRNRALHLYEEKYGPMRYGMGGPGAPYSVKWVTQAWPWEGGEL